ncbi:MAG: DUF4429 domain-containing protein, partial [Chryseobacterium sp.]|nr:DUF4429 domain-containing protein [Chryseobacterium sp.]
IIVMEKEYIFKSKGKSFVKIKDDKISIIKKGIIYAVNQGFKGEKTLFIKDISAIQVKKSGLLIGYLQFSLKGGYESKGGVMDATKDENTILIGNKKDYLQALEIKEYVENFISNSSSTPSIKSLPEQIKEYKSLLDEGIITEDEYNVKKADLLSK